MNKETNLTTLIAEKVDELEPKFISMTGQNEDIKIALRTALRDIVEKAMSEVRVEKKKLPSIERPERWNERIEREWEKYLMDEGWNAAITAQEAKITALRGGHYKLK